MKREIQDSQKEENKAEGKGNWEEKNTETVNYSMKKSYLNDFSNIIRKKNVTLALRHFWRLHYLV